MTLIWTFPFRVPNHRALRSAVLALAVASGTLLVPATGATAQPTQAGSEDGALVLGGTDFVRSYLGMIPGRVDDFLHELAEYLQEPGMRTRAVHLDTALEELQKYDELLADLRRKHGSEAPSFAQANSYAYAKARDLVDWFGVRHRERNGAVTLELRGGDTQELRREIFAHLGFDIEALRTAWTAGEPIDMAVPRESVPVLFGIQAWNREVFENDLRSTAFFRAFLIDEEARWVMLGYSRLDPDTRTTARAAIGLRDPYRDGRVSRAFADLAYYLRGNEGTIALPGGSATAWRKILGNWNSTGDLVRRLVRRDDGRAAHLWRALSLIPARRAEYLLTLGATNSNAVEEWADDLYGSVRIPGRKHALRWRGDVADLFLELRLRGDGNGIDWPGGGKAWVSALRRDRVVGDSVSLGEELRDRRVQEAAEHGAVVDREILRRLVRGFEGEELVQGTHAIERFLAVQAALRYTPEARTPRTITLLYRNYDRFAQAYGFLVGRTPIAPDNVERFVFFLARAESAVDERQRRAAARQAQSTLLILKRLLDNGRLDENQRHETLWRLFNLELDDDAGGFGRGLAGWWREYLLPALGIDPQADGEATEAALVESLAARGEPADVELDGIAYRFSPAEQWSRRIRDALRTQQLAHLGFTLALDGLAAEYETWTREQLEAAGDEIEQRVRPPWNAFQESTDSEIYGDEGDKEVRLPRKRSDLLSRMQRILREARQGGNRPEHFEDARKHLVTPFSDALLAVAYAIHIDDPDGLYFSNRQLAWLHRMGPLEESPADTGPWLATREVRDETVGLRLLNSVFGMPQRMGHWALRMSTLQGDVSYAARPIAENWSEAVFAVQPGSLTAMSLETLTTRLERATAWVETAATASDPATPAPWLTPSDDAPHLDDMLALLHRSPDAWHVRQLISSGDVEGSLGALTQADLYLLAWGADELAGAIDPDDRWHADQLAGLPYWRGAGSLGLVHPNLVPRGEAADAITDGLLYARVVGARVALARALADNGYPANLASPLLLRAFGAVLEAIDPDTASAWDEVAATIPVVITAQTVRDWVLEMAFEEDLTLADSR